MSKFEEYFNKDFIHLKDEQKESSNTKSKVPDEKEVTSYKNMYF